jgi:hypothetical protein
MRGARTVQQLLLCGLGTAAASSWISAEMKALPVVLCAVNMFQASEHLVQRCTPRNTRKPCHDGCYVGLLLQQLLHGSRDESSPCGIVLCQHVSRYANM